MSGAKHSAIEAQQKGCKCRVVMPRSRSNLTSDAIWDLEDKYTALAGSASGLTMTAQRAETATALAPRAVSPKRISGAYEVIHVVREGIEAGITKSGVYGVRAKRQGESGSKATKPNVARGARGKKKSG